MDSKLLDDLKQVSFCIQFRLGILLEEVFPFVCLDFTAAEEACLHDSPLPPVTVTEPLSVQNRLVQLLFASSVFRIDLEQSKTVINFTILFILLLLS